MHRTRHGLLALVTVGLVTSACSFSYSSEKFSDSSKSSFESSSSSSPGANQRGYRTDVSDYTSAYVKSSRDLGNFESGLVDLARKRGITDWEDDSDTWVGIGAGLGRAGVSSVQLDVYKQNLSHGDPTRMAGIQKGYESVEP